MYQQIKGGDRKRRMDKKNGVDTGWQGSRELIFHYASDLKLLIGFIHKCSLFFLHNSYFTVYYNRAKYMLA